MRFCRRLGYSESQIAAMRADGAIPAKGGLQGERI